MNDMSDTEFDLADFLPYKLSVTSNAVSNWIAQVYRREFGLKVTEWRIMAMLGDAGALTQRQLTARTLMDKVAVNRACKALVQRGLVQRKPNEMDGRSHLLGLTAQGAQMHSQIIPRAREIEARLMATLGQNEESAFRAVLDRILAQASEHGPQLET